MIPTIFFITGTSGAGKTTLIQHLKNKLPNEQFEIYDFDELGLPPDADKLWRLKTTDHWLKVATENSQNGKSTIICGVTVPSEIVQWPQKPDLPQYFGFMKLDDQTIRQRLQARKWDEKTIQDNISWAHHLEKEITKQENHLIVDGTVSPQEIAEKFVSWILKLSC